MSKNHRRQRGVALMLAILALIVLSAIGIGMLVSADSETAIAANYRDKQVALYGAQSGLQEARERLRSDDVFNPVSGASVPAGLPGTGAKLANIIYIINPGAGESASDIKPWVPPTDTSPNPYYDSDICTKVPSICSGTPKVPSQTSGYTVINHATETSTIGKLFATAAANTSYKWVRIMLKADNMIPNVPVQNGTNAASGVQVCYDPTQYRQFPKTSPAYDTYGIKCMAPQGTVASLLLTAGGYGYSANPTVTIASPPSGGTTATATLDTAIDFGNEHLTSIVVTNAGSAYDKAPLVTIDPPTAGLYPVQATATATIVSPGRPVASGSVTNAGSPSQGCYSFSTSPVIPALNATGDTGSGATFTVAMTGQSCIYAANIGGTCKSSKNSTVNITDSNSGFAGSVKLDAQGKQTGLVTITNPGTTVASSITVQGCPGLTLAAGPSVGYHFSTSGNAVTVTNGGSGYVTAPTLNFPTPNAGNKPASTTTLGSIPGNAGQVIAITITNPGSGYIGAPNVTLTSVDGVGAGATAVASVAPTRKISAIHLQNQGSGYTSAPAVTITDSSGKAATAIATLPDGASRDAQVFVVTALAKAAGGSIAMAELETARTFMPLNLASGGLILGGPSPSFVPPNSANMVINGRDSNSCGETSYGNKPAIGAYDDPNNVTNPTATQQISSVITGGGAKPGNFIGVNGSGDVGDIYDSLGPPATAASYLNDVVSTASSMPGANVYSSNPSSINMGSVGSPAIDVVNGDYTISGNPSGYGILIVTGTLTMSGDFSWHGPILVIGKGNVVFSGGGNGQITGMVFVANTQGGSGDVQVLDPPDATWSGGGGNGIQYDHCWADNQLKRLNMNPPVVQNAMKVLSLRSLGN